MDEELQVPAKEVTCSPASQENSTKCCYLAWATLGLQVITLILVGSLTKLSHCMLHRAHRFSECRPPVHRFYDDENRVHKYHSDEDEEHMLEIHHGEEEQEPEQEQTENEEEAAAQDPQ